MPGWAASTRACGAARVRPHGSTFRWQTCGPTRRTWWAKWRSRGRIRSARWARCSPRCTRRGGGSGRMWPAGARETGAPGGPGGEVPVGPLPHPAAGSRERGAVPSGATALPVSVPSFGLEDGDVVVVDPLPDEPEAYFVSITGMIQNPGRYPWRAGMTLRDLVRLARGPRVGALLREVEIARLPADRAQGQLATTVRAPMDSTHLFDRDSAGRYIDRKSPRLNSSPSQIPNAL